MSAFNYAPFRFWCHKVLPLVYDDSLSYYEVLCKLQEYINNIIEDLKIDTEQTEENTTKITQLENIVRILQNEVEEIQRTGLVPNFGGTWSNSVIYPKYTIVYYSENGNSYMSKQNVPAGILPTNTTYWQLTANYDAQLNEIYAAIDENTDDINELKRTSEERELSDALWMESHMFVNDLGVQPQGSCIVRINNVDYLYSIFFYGNDQNDVLRRIRMSDGAVVNSLTGYNFKHGNTITYNPNNGNLYITEVNNKYCNVVKASTMEYIDRVEFGHELNMCSWHDNKFYCATPLASHTVYVYNDTDITNPIDTIVLETTDALWNGMYVDDDYIYLTQLRDTENAKGTDGVAVYYHDGKLRGVVDAPTSTEIEDIAGVIDGKFYMTAYMANGMSGFYAQIFKDGITYNSAQRTKPRRVLTNILNKTVYLDNTYTDNLSDGTQTRPFKTYPQLVHFSMLTLPTNININIAGDFSDTIFRFDLLNQIKTLSLGGSGTIGGVIAFNGDIQISDLTITNNGDIDVYYGVVNCFYGRTTIQNVTFNGTGTLHAIYLNTCNAVIKECTFNTTKGIFANNCSLCSIDPDNTFNCSGIYFRAANGSKFNLNKVPIGYCNKICTNDDINNMFEGSVKLDTNDNFNTIRVGCRYYTPSITVARTIQNVPDSTANFVIYVNYTVSQTNMRAHFVNINGDEYVAIFTNGSWGDWKQITLTSGE